MTNISKSLRFEILRRDNYACQYCGGKAPDVELQVDHIMPVTLGGSNNPSNLTASCRDCNIGKGASVPDGPTVNEVESRHLKWQGAMAQAIEEVAVKANLGPSEAAMIFITKWPSYYSLPSGWERSIDTIIERGLPLSEINRAVGITLSAHYVTGAANKFRYFCGICTNLIQEIRKRAEQIMAMGSDAE